MERCDTCGAEYHDMLRIERAGKVHHFDSFECAIHKLAPRCNHCGCRVIGHGVEENERIYCCSHCLRETVGVHPSDDVPLRSEH